MHLNKMNKLTALSLNFINNSIADIDINNWLKWSEKLVDLNLDLRKNRIKNGYNDNMNLEDVNDNCEVYVNIWDGKNEEQYK